MAIERRSNPRSAVGGRCHRAPFVSSGGRLPAELLLDRRDEHVGHALIFGHARMPVATGSLQRILRSHVHEGDFAAVAAVRSDDRLHVAFGLVVLRGAEQLATKWSTVAG